MPAVVAAQSEGDLFPTCKSHFPILISNREQEEWRIEEKETPEVMHELLLLPIPLVEEADVVLQVLREEGRYE